jgi:hypothetical protein
MASLDCDPNARFSEPVSVIQEPKKIIANWVCWGNAYCTVEILEGIWKLYVFFIFCCLFLEVKERFVECMELYVFFFFFI